jgi:hypothetical protein
MLISKNFLTREASYKPSYLTSWSQSGRAGTALACGRGAGRIGTSHGRKIVTCYKIANRTKRPGAARCDRHAGRECVELVRQMRKANQLSAMRARSLTAGKVPIACGGKGMSANPRDAPTRSRSSGRA